MHLLHIHADGTAPVAADLHTLFGAGATHALVTGEATNGGSTIDHIDFPPLTGPPLPARLKRLATAMRDFDLVLSHGAGALDAAMAHTLFARPLSLPPLVHHEEHADRVRSRRRDWYRRIALGQASAVIVPTEALQRVALADWQQPAARVRLIPPGVDIATFARKLRPDALPRLIKRQGERWLGAFEGDETTALLDALAALPEAWQLVWFGASPAREALRAAAMARDLGHRVHTPGAVSLPSALGLLDLVTLPADPDPGLVAAAMAAGLPVCAPQDATLAELLSPANATALGQPAAHFADDRVRRQLSEANRARATAQFDARKNLALRKAIYEAALASAPAA